MDNATGTATVTSYRDARILIIDDDPGFIRILGGMLNEFDDQHFATSALEGLRIARQIVPDLILIDFEMPDLSGADLCAIFKSDQTLRMVPIIFITSHIEIADVTATFKAGGDDFLPKPVSRSLLLERVRAQLGLRIAPDGQSALRDAELQ